MIQLETERELKNGFYIKVFYINHLKSREIAEKIIRSYLPVGEPTKEENLDFTNSYKITELQYGNDFYYLIDSIWDYELILVHDNSRKIRNLVEEIGDKVIEAISNYYFENGDFDIDYYGDVDWYFSGNFKENIKEGESTLEIEIKGEKHKITPCVYKDNSGNINVKQSCSECMNILIETIKKEFEMEKEIDLYFG